MYILNTHKYVTKSDSARSSVSQGHSERPLNNCFPGHLLSRVPIASDYYWFPNLGPPKVYSCLVVYGDNTTMLIRYVLFRSNIGHKGY